MKIKTSIIDGINAQLGSETVKTVELVQIKGGSAKQMMKDIAASTAVSLVTAPLTGWGLRRQTFPPVAWIVVTEKRVLLFATDMHHQTLGGLIFDAPIDLLGIEYSERLFKSISINNKAANEKIVVLNFGMRRSAYTSTRDALRS